MTNPITPNDILDIVDYTIEFPLFIAATTLEQTVECNVDYDVFLEWCQYCDNFEYHELNLKDPDEINVELILSHYYFSKSAKDLLFFVINHKPNLIKIQ